MYHCFFEQSGTFKNELKKLGYEAKDYDILNQFGETDVVIDLYSEIEAERERESIFSNIKEGDTIIAFFPCVRFEAQIKLWFRGDCYSQRNWDNKKKLEYCLKLHDELNKNYKLITQLVLICIERNIKLIIENPYSQSYLTDFWCMKPKVIDTDRTKSGDYYKKPTQYWFINCEPKNNEIEIENTPKERKSISNVSNTVERSMISKEYARNFIKRYIVEM